MKGYVGNIKVGRRQVEVYDQMPEYEAIQLTDLANKTGLSVRNVHNALQRLKAAGIVERVGRGMYIGREKDIYRGF